VENKSGFDELVGRDTNMQVVYKLIEEVAPTDATVLIQGESGTGKELVARAIHRASHRKSMPFVVINCSAYPKALLESELFGHEKGAFTGALRRKKGRFEQADGGTVFLDEIGEITASAQIKLLRVLQNHKFERIGGEDSLYVDVRILAATNRDLLEEVKAGRFREDLYYRLNVIPITLPPLRERANDIPLLARFFLARFAKEQGKSVEQISPDAMRKLLDYSWPGNVRELENSIEHAVVLAKGEEIFISELPSAVTSHAGEQTTAKLTILENEAKLIRDALEQSNWNKTTAAARLGISRSTLYEKLKKYRLSKSATQ
jgi:two-component system response regulator HydG